MQLEITQACIDAADKDREAPRRRNPCFICPIAQALRSEGYKRVSVGEAGLLARGHKWSLTNAAADFMAQWDQGYPVRPTTLELEETA